ncbi:MAG: hypothetical protein EU547_00630 [Promethearchaeota archaeon]|nr:MAG: hypothetical protein EU547_00630 [Candidatus Lokiarchaeota archaeon]
MASNISISKTHIERFFQEEDLDNIPLSTERTTYHPYKYSFISEVVTILYLHSKENISDELHKIITVLIEIPDNKYERKEFKEVKWKIKTIQKNKGKEGLHLPINENLEYEIEDYLNLLKQVRSLVSCCKRIQDKGDLCKLERQLMLIYLKKLNKK